MAAYNEESVQWLYDKLQDGYDTGSLDEFKEDLKDDETRKWYHNEATKMGLNVGDEDTFRSLVVPEEVEAPQRTGTVVDQTIDDINRATGHMPQEVQDMAFSGQPQTNGQSLAEKNNPQMFQQPAVDTGFIKPLAACKSKITHPGYIFRYIHIGQPAAV